MYQQQDQQPVYNYGQELPQNRQFSFDDYRRQADNYARNDDKSTFTQDMFTNQPAMTFTDNNDVSRLVDLPTLPPLNTTSLTNRTPQEKWMTDTRSANMIPQQQQQQPDASVLVQYQRDDRRTLVTSPYSRQPELYNGGEMGPYGCGVMGCFATFPASNALFYHMKNTHPSIDDIEKPFKCAMPNCSKRYKNINGLQYHLRDAKGSSGHGTGEQEMNAKAFVCQIPGCKKAYRTQNGLRSHQQRGHNVQPSMLQQQPQQHLPPHLMQSIQQQMNLHQMQQQFRPQ